MRRAAVLIVAVVSWTTTARAAPEARLVQAWLPGVERAPIAAAIEQAGIAFVDHTPAPPPAVSVAGDVATAIDAYEALRLDDAWTALERARAAVDATGGALSNAALSDLFVYRALVRSQRGDLSGAWDEWIAAATVAPTRVLDPARFSPQVIADYARARTAVAAQPTVTVTVTGGEGCAVQLDGAAVGATVTAAAGRHWVRGACPGAEPFIASVQWNQPTAVLAIAPTPIAAPTDDALRVIARGSGADQYVVANVVGAVVVVRRFSGDGRVVAERAVAVAAGPRAIATAVLAVVGATKASSSPWYRSRWVWAAGAASVTAAVVVPLTIWLAGSGDRGGATIVGPGAAL